jgi:hypothetical protein
MKTQLKRVTLCALALLATSCGVAVEVRTDPTSVDIPVTSVGSNFYAEVAVDIPAASLGDIVVEELDGDLFIRNLTNRTTMNLSLMISTRGTATPGTPFFFTEINKPAYVNQAIVLVPQKAYGPNSRTAERIVLDANARRLLLSTRRIYLIVSNTVTSAGIGDVPPFNLRLEDATLHARVSKSLQSANGALDLSGL